MALSRTEKWLLRRYEQYAMSPPTFRALLKAALRHLLVIAALGAAGACLLHQSGEAVAASFFAGTALGAILRQLGQLRVAAAAAPVLSRIIDLERVRRLLQTEEPHE